MCKPFLNSNPKVNSYIHVKQNMQTQCQTQILVELVPLMVPLLKKSTHNEGKHWVPVSHLLLAYVLMSSLAQSLCPQVPYTMSKL